jgi:SAM-dependent methyltransferase
MKILNLGSGTKTSAHPAVVNIDWSAYLLLKRNPVLRRVAPKLLKGQRRQRFLSLPDNVVGHDLSKGIPADDGSVDAVYHSHLLEHLDRPVAERFMLEVRRVLAPGGIHRIVVPDLERLCRQLLDHLGVCADDIGERARHDEHVAALLEQAVRREAYGMTAESGLTRVAEKLLVGDARRRGETHQWMYDWANLTALLERSGFDEIEVCDHDGSRVPDWSSFGLDRDDSGAEYKPGSLYVEAVRPR